MIGAISEPESPKPSLERREAEVFDQDVLSLVELARFLKRFKILIAACTVSGMVIALIPTLRNPTYDSSVALESSMEDPMVLQDPRKITDALVDAFSQGEMSRLFARKFVTTLRELSEKGDSALQESAKLALLAWHDSFSTDPAVATDSGLLKIRFSLYLRDQMTTRLRGDPVGASGLKYFLRVEDSHSPRLVMSLSRRGAAPAATVATISSLNEMIVLYNKRVESWRRQTLTERSNRAKARYEEVWSRQSAQIQTYEFQRSKLMVELYRISEEIGRIERKAGVGDLKDVKSSSNPFSEGGRGGAVMGVMMQFTPSETADGVEKFQSAFEINNLGRRLARLADSGLLDDKQLSKMLTRIADIEAARIEHHNGTVSVRKSLLVAEDALVAMFRESTLDMITSNASLAKVSDDEDAVKRALLEATVDQRSVTSWLAGVYGAAAGLCLALLIGLAFQLTNLGKFVMPRSSLLSR